jgi:5-methyltetrahydropteroyltriglutamate--homocysteine methyltransferase
LKRSTERILTTHAGRLPAPSTMGALAEARAAGDDERVAALIEAGVEETVRRQKECGVDIVSDGEFSKPALRDHRYYASRVSGLESRERRPGESLWFGERSPETLDPRFARFFAFVGKAGMFPDAGPGAAQAGTEARRLVVTGPLEYRGQEPIKRELEMAAAGLGAAQIEREDAFYPQLAPGWIEHFIWNEHYESEEAYVYALAEAWKGEYDAVVEAGFVLQLDDPALVDRYYMFNPPISVEEYRRHAELRVEATNHALRDIPEERIRYHVCWGSWHYPHTRDLPLRHIIDLLLRVKAQAYSIEASNVRHQLDHRVWEDVRLPEGKILIPGVVGHATSNLVEAPEVVAERLLTYARIVGRENVIAGTDCGLGGRCHDDVAWAKLEAMGRGAELASRALWR